jgi:hypothetical protein
MSLAGGKLRVLIATTNGPVEVQLLTEEDPVIGRCVACIGGTTETADIAAAYHAFVVRPTGVIEARFGHPCYRLDVSGRIDAGSSWQLGVFVAHALLSVGRLAQENDVADGILWVTGSVRPVDLTVGAVSHVPEKLANSLDRLKQELNARRPVLLAVPVDNAADVSPSATKELLALGAETITVSHAQALFYVLGLKLPLAGSKGSAPTSGAVAFPEEAAPAKVEQAVSDKLPQQRPVSTKSRPFYGWAAAAALIGIVGAGAVTGLPQTVLSLLQSGSTGTLPSPTLASTASQPIQPSQPVSKGVELAPETIPFIKASDRQRVRDEYLPAPNYKALAMTMYEISFVSGQPSQESADKAAMEACETSKRRPSTDTSLTEIEYRCDLFASGAFVVSQRTNIAMPPQPWINAPAQKPFVAAELPMVSQENKDSAERRYLRLPRSKALIVSPAGRLFLQYAQSSPEEAMRRSLERCGYISKSPCLVVAVDDSFTAALPTSAKVVGFYRPDSLLGVQAEERAEVARRLAASSEGWNAVALGATRHAGTKVGARSERSAVDGAMENCALYDQDCRIAVIGPFLVQPALDLVPATPPPRLALPAPAASPALQADPAPLPSYAPPAAAVPVPATPSPSASNASPAAAAASVPPASSASTVPPAFRPLPKVRTTKQTTLER